MNRLDRVHLHNLGYYVIVCASHISPADDVIGASLCSALNALKAMHGGFPDANAMPAGANLLSEIGFAQLEQFSREMTGRHVDGPGWSKMTTAFW